MKKNSTLQNKIKTYSAIALSVAGIGSLKSQIIYHDVVLDNAVYSFAKLNAAIQTQVVANDIIT